MMHILYLASWYPTNEDDINGCFFREQAHAMEKAGHKVGVIAPQFRSLRMGKKTLLNKYGTEIWQDNNVTTYLYHDIFWFPRIPYIDLHRWVKKGLALFEKYIKEQGIPDLIHVQSVLLAGPLALKIYQNYQIPYCVMEHSSTFARGLVKKWQINYINKVIEKSNYNMAVSENLANLLTNRLFNSQWHYFPNLLDKIFEQPIEKNKVINKKQFCTVARLDANKNISTLIQSFAKVLQKFPDYCLVVAGDGPEHTNLVNLVAKLNIGHAVTFLGSISREDVKKLMAESFCFVLASRIETFGVVVIEALSQGLPVIATKCGGPESIIKPADGRLVAVEDINALSDAMMDIIAQSDKYNTEHIRNRCLERFSEKTFTTNMSVIYDKCRTNLNIRA